MPIKIITPPAVEPVTFDEVKLQVKLDVDDERDLIEGIYISAAREDCEDFHGWSYVERTLEYVIDRWPSGDRIYLPRPPVQEILSVYYLDKDGNEVVFDDWLPSLDGDPMVVLKPGCSWPTAALCPAGAVRVRYVSGYPAKESETEHAGEEVGTGDGKEIEFTLKNAPVKEGSVTIYLDGAGTADYTLNRETGQIVFNEPPGEDVSITAGYIQEVTDPCGFIPFAVKAAILQTIASYVENREAVAGRGHIPQKIPGTAEDLLWKTRYFWCEELNR
jgi:uncharacterized phiE125 gp8 family phage protein